ncbi:unnamed protein product [Sphagnum troendelagicum]|uniref:BSD domain-containing protein n=1 Tax=Sphagnum troendelagicum TaxID=128251 RepID=A0ABP0U485_9BRYO
MSWFASSLSLKPRLSSPRQGDAAGDNDDEGAEERDVISEHAAAAAAGKGVKEDLSELTKSLTRQLWGVASFLAPPPPPAEESSIDSPKPSSSPNSAGQRLIGFCSDLAELRGTVATSFSRIHALSSGFGELSKFASSLLPFARDMVGEFSDREYAVGVTDEVVAFANNIAMHPETWLDFPLADEEDDDDFEMTEAQQEHADAVKHEASRLGAVHFELCPDIISNERFWKIYFVLLHSRLSKQDADLLSTPQIVKARGLLLQQLQDGEVAMGEGIPGQSGEKELVMGNVDVGVSYDEPQVMRKDVDDIGINLITTDAHAPARIESLADTQGSKQPSTVESASPTLVDDETEVNEWLENRLTNAGGLDNADEDVSFSDLEDDENDINQGKDASLLVPGEIEIDKSGQGTSNDPSQVKEFSGDTTPGSKFERVEFNDWFTVNEEDVASADSSP